MRTMVVPALAVALVTSAAAAQVVLTPSHQPHFATANLVFDDRSRADALVDVNLDGRMDALGVWETRASRSLRDLRAFQNDGKGNFVVKELMTRMTAPAAAAGEPDLVVADWDGDGHHDFALDERSGAVSFFVASKNGPTALGRQTFADFKAAAGLVGADFNGDKRADLAVLTDTGLFVYLSNKGMPSVLGALSTETGTALRLLDADKNGRMDLLLVNGQKLTLLRIDGGSSWTARNDKALVVLARFDSAASSTFHPACGDIDGDGDDDVVCFGANGSYEVLRQGKPGAFALEQAKTGGPATALADVDGDGDLDGICCGGGGNGRTNIYASTFEICRNLGGGTFEPSQRFANVGARHVAGAADMDGDGHIEIVGGRGMLDARLLASRKLVVLDEAGKPNQVPWSATRILDQDGDGDVDILTNGTWPLRNDGSGRLRLESAKTHTYGSTALWGDYDGDGDQDYLVWEPSANAFQMFRNVDGRTFEALGSITPAGTLYDPGKVWTLDVNGDGRCDIVTHQSVTFLSGGGTKFERIDHQGKLNLLNVKDINGDGYADFLGYGPTHLSIRLGQQNGSIGAAISLYDSWSLSSAKHLDLVDSDGDGDYDIWAILGSDLVWFENRGSAVLHKHIILSGVSTSTSTLFEMRDVDGNGTIDAVVNWTWNLGGWVHLALQGKPGEFTTYLQAIPQQVVGVADLDADGDLDLVAPQPAACASFDNERGLTQQYGSASHGSSGVRPILGATGPFRVGSVSGLHLRAGRGGDMAMIVSGLTAVDQIDYPVKGFNLLVWPTFIHTVVALRGDSGSLGTGHWFADIILPKEVAGLTLFHQAYLFEPTAPAGIVSTNGVRIDYRK